MNLLSQALVKARSASEFNDIFENNVNVALGWMNDQVTIDGYQGAVTTDFIANRIMLLSRSISLNDSETEELASHLANKVFIPLKNLVESPKNQCSPYQLAALTRVVWTPPPAQEFGNSVALKHAMVLGVLDLRYANW